MASNFGNLAINITEHAQEHFVVTLVMTETNGGLNDFNKSISAIHEVISIHGDDITDTITLIMDGYSYTIAVSGLQVLTINGTNYTDNYAGALAELNTSFNFSS